ncbi:hypothetical protein T11_7662 [Trichinella zimbabwensis]|uniref:Uncharacterized protein n=1 Tax=Trichinella zimbabwensis TaxID=268475 RepID=A0A0V1HTQ8_9BILA|nr:hypothetical protein T11_7662 [Trichinella zimbabwensis]
MNNTPAVEGYKLSDTHTQTIDRLLTDNLAQNGRQVTDVPHDGTVQVLDVDSRRDNCCIASVPVTNQWAIASLFLVVQRSWDVLMAINRSHHPDRQTF